MKRFRTYRSPLVMALCAMMAHLLMGFGPVTAAPVPGQALSLAEALAVVCTANGAETDGTAANHACNHCVLCAPVAAKFPVLPLLAVAYPATSPAIWRTIESIPLAALDPPFNLPFAQAPPPTTPITL